MRVAELEKQFQGAERERGILKSDGLFHAGESVQFFWRPPHRKVFDLAARRDVLQVNRQGYYAWKDRPAVAVVFGWPIYWYCCISSLAIAQMCGGFLDEFFPFFWELRRASEEPYPTSVREAMHWA